MFYQVSKRLGAAAVLAAVVNATAAQAATVNIDRVETDPLVSEFGIRDDTITLGSDLVGMIVTASFADGSTEIMTWEHVLNARGQVTTDDFSVIYAGRNFDVKTGRALTSLNFNAGAGNAVFDSVFVGEDDPANTAGTSFGWPFKIETGDTMTGILQVTYSGSFVIEGEDRGGDTFTEMLIDFTGLSGGSFTGTFGFSLDLDSLEVAGDLTEVSTMPLPAGASLLLAGIGAFGLMRRKKG